MRFLPALVLVCLSAGVVARADNFLILPFFNLSKDANLDWIGESLAETVRETLAAEGTLALSREDREEAYKRLSLKPQAQLTRATVIRLAETVDAHQVIYGTFDFTPPPEGAPKIRGTLRIAAHIINLKQARRGPEYTEIGALEDLARLQTHLAWQTLSFVLPRSAPTEDVFRARRPVVRVDAIESYIRGLLAPAGEQKFKFMSQAVRLDPSFSPANFQMGRLLCERKNYRAAAEHLSKVAPTDVRYREARFVLGLAKYRSGDFAASAQAFRSVAEAVPLNEVWNNLGAAQSRMDSPEAAASFQKALEGDPADPDYHFNAGYALFRAGEYVSAAERFRAVLERNPDDVEATTMLGRCLKPPAQRRNSKSDGIERLKDNFEESAYLQLKAVLEAKQ